jgi:uncharacterized protein (DUF2252 family)
MATKNAGAAAGRAARDRAPLRSHARWAAPPDRPDPVGLLERYAQALVQDLVPVRHGRMLRSPAAFFAGAAAIMSSDLGRTPASGLRVQLNGDAQIANFGAFAPALQDPVFDFCDFDETLPGPWEWDVKRLAASVEVAARDQGVPSARRFRMVTAVAGMYQSAMRDFARRPYLSLWYGHLNPKEDGTPAAAAPSVRKSAGRVRFVGKPLSVEPLREVLDREEAALLMREMRSTLLSYGDRLDDEGRRILGQYAFRDVARVVAGVRGAATQTLAVLMTAPRDSEPLVLEVKEAGRSVLEPYAGAVRPRHNARRVVEGERLTEASRDMLLGWVRGMGLYGVVRDYVVRQLRRSQPGPMNARALGTFARACGWTLARAHARTGDRFALAAYMGSRPAFPDAIARFAAAYADQNASDYQQFRAAVARGRIVVRADV